MINAMTTAANNQPNPCKFLLGMTSSMRYLLAPGNIRLANLLIMMSRRPTDNLFKRG